MEFHCPQRITSSRRTAGVNRPCRDAGVGDIAPGFAVLERAKRASHIDPLTSSYAIMRRARPYRGENHGPGKDVQGELDLTPGIREQPGHQADIKKPYCDRYRWMNGHSSDAT